MPITREEFNASEEAETEHSTAEAIILYLADHDELAFTRQEIADAINRNPNTVSTNLSRLKNRGFVEHRDEYWAITDDENRLEELAETVRTLPSTEAGFDDETPIIEDEEDAEAWAEAAAEYPGGENTEQAEASALEHSNNGLSWLEMKRACENYGLFGDSSSHDWQQTPRHPYLALIDDSDIDSTIQSDR